MAKPVPTIRSSGYIVIVVIVVKDVLIWGFGALRADSWDVQFEAALSCPWCLRLAGDEELLNRPLDTS